jgi:diguanylate cyclase (GGDEF)-like protein
MAKLTFKKQETNNFQPEKKSYNILIVDDEEAIHNVTNMALKSMNFSTFDLKVFNAYNAEEAKALIETHEIALALIDVVMETPEAGLELVNYIRETLNNDIIRLIIRTGQANDFPQMQIIQHYDINDFKEKTELTLERLYTTIRTSIKQYEQLVELEHKYEETYRQMTTNPLTRLPNRVKLVEDFAKKEKQTLILIDIVGFSIINDTNGYEVGDFVLKELGGFLSSMYGGRFDVYHLNNDLFALVINEEDYDNLLTTVQQIKDDIAQLHMITGNFNKTIETTIGVAFQSENDVMRKAELALKEARNTGRNQIKFYSEDLRIIQQISETNSWAPVIKHALETGGFEAYAQPIFDIKSGEIDKYELLVRLNDDGKVFSPFHFLAAAQHSGYLYNIFMFMFEEGCRQAAATGNRYNINISDCEFRKSDLVAFIRSTLERYAIDPSLISLEILESSAISHSPEIKEMITRIHELGIGFVIDDFGVQCSNFGQAQDLPVDTLKIDGSFIQNIDTSKNSQIIAKTIRTFAQEKGLKLVAEFVCNEKVYEIVRELGIDYAQGYYLGEPKPLDR